MKFEIDKLPDDQAAASWLRGLGVVDSKRGLSNLRSIAQSNFSSLAGLLERLERQLPNLSDPDRALNNLERLTTLAPDHAHTILGEFEKSQPDTDSFSFADLLSVFSASQYLSDLLIRNASHFQQIWKTKKGLRSREQITESLIVEIQATRNPNEAMKVLRQFKHRETLRIAIADLSGRQRLEPTTKQISFTAMAIVEAAYKWARRELARKHGQPLNSAASPSRFVVLAMGKLGGSELNYSSDIDLVFFYSADGETNGRRAIANRDFFDRVGRQFVKLLTENTPLGVAYRVDMRLRPGGNKAPLSCSFDKA